MSIKETQHAVYDIKCHFVWIPKYRKKVLTREIRERVKKIFEEVANQYEVEIDTMEVMKDHVDIFLSASPRYSPAKIVNIIRGISSRKILREFPWMKRYLWAGILNDGPEKEFCLKKKAATRKN